MVSNIKDNGLETMLAIAIVPNPLLLRGDWVAVPGDKCAVHTFP